jgi:peptidoglycan/xylan/chitin deacetylase (PgdA/CDA1 family)
MPLKQAIRTQAALPRTPTSFRDVVAGAMARVGIVKLMEQLPARAQLLVLNYHRIGDRTATRFDPGVFSTDSEGLDEQLRVLRQRYTIVTPDESLDVIEGRYRPREPLVLLTFDDGYRDNLEQAFPVLRAHGASAVFFVVTSYTNDNQLPWWDKVAALARRCAANGATMRLPGAATDVVLDNADIPGTIRSVLKAYKRMPISLQAPFIDELERGAGDDVVALTDRLILDWDDVRTLKAGGMSIGVHSHSHRILSQLPPEEQLRELKVSKAIVEQESGSTASFLAYPDGSHGTFDASAKEAAAAAGFRVGFSFYGGINFPGRIDPYDVKRSAFQPYSSSARLRVAATMLSAGVTRWI